MTPYAHLAAGAVLSGLGLPLLIGAVRLLHVEVHEREAVYVTVRGRHRRTLTRPGLHWLPARLLPGVSLTRRSLRWEPLQLQGIAVEGPHGVTVRVDVWLEARVADPTRLPSPCHDWAEDLRARVPELTRALLLGLDARAIVRDFRPLGRLLGAWVSQHVAPLGVEVGTTVLTVSAGLPGEAPIAPTLRESPV